MKRILILLALFSAVCGVRAEDLERPLLLVASPALQGPYARTALLVFPMRGQHAGFILNRSTDVKMASVFPDHAPSAKVADPIYFGGPEMMDSLFAIVRRDPGAGSMRVLGDLFVTAEADCLDRIIETTPNDARYFAGFVGWKTGELATENSPTATGTPSRSTPPRRSARTRARCGTNWSSAWATATRARPTCTACITPR